MKVIILGGGQATRLHPLTCNTVKIMIPVLNRPLLEHLIGYLKKHSISGIILALGNRQLHQVRSYFGDGSKFDVKIDYSVEDFPMGTAGAVKNAEALLDDEPFTVFNGDIFTDINLGAMIELHHHRRALVSIALTTVEDPTAYGVLETDAEGKVKRFVEKPKWDDVNSNMINAGVYILESEILSYITPGVFSMFERDVFPPLLDDGRNVYSYPSNDYWIDTGTPEKYLRLNCDLIHRYLGNDVKFEGESVVHRRAQIDGPVLIGKSCSIDRNSVIKGPAVLGADCQIGEGAEIEKAVLWQNCQIDRRARLENCILAYNCHIEEESELERGCVLGDNVRIGKRNRLPHGTRIWPDKYIEPNETSF
mgnify:CR=1 FL=1